MPRISSFYGITIWMYYDEASVDIETLELIAGELPVRARRLVVEWARIRGPQLRDNWERARRKQPLVSIEPLR